MSIEIPQVPFCNNIHAGFRRNERPGRYKGLERLIKDTKSYVFRPLEDDFERHNLTTMLRMEEQGIHGDIEALYSNVNELRQSERKEMIKRGYLDDENSKRTLDNAISFRGTCIDMCPVFERIKRTRQNNVNSNEKDPSTNVISRQRAIKSFARPAAGQEPPLPSDVRPPSVLVKTLDFITNNLLDKMPETQSFIWDRTRSIRQDFTFQNYFGPETVECNERIVRIHILSLHIMANSTIEYSQQQELEQLEKSLKTLSEMYDEYRKKGFPVPPNEAEFRAYHLLLKLNDPDLERHYETLPSPIFNHNLIQLALYVRRLYSLKDVPNTANLYTTLFDTILGPQTLFLSACLLEIHFNAIRYKSLKAIINSNHSKSKNLTLMHLFEVLRFPDYNDLKLFLEFYNIKWFLDNNGNESINMATATSGLNKRSTDGPPKVMKSAYDPRLDIKSNGMSCSEIVNSGVPNNISISIPTAPINAEQEQERLKLEEQQRKQDRLKQEILKKQEFLRKKKEQELEAQKQKELLLKQQEEQRRKQEEQRLKEQQEQLRKQKEEQLRKEQERLRKQQEEKLRLEQERLRKQQEEQLRRQQEQFRKRKLKMQKLAGELYTSFLNEIVYTTFLEVTADDFRVGRLKTEYVKRIKAVAKRCQIKQEEEQRKIDEFNTTQKTIGLAPNLGYVSKRLNIINNFKKHDPVSLAKISQENDIMSQLEASHQSFTQTLVLPDGASKYLKGNSSADKDNNSLVVVNPHENAFLDKSPLPMTEFTQLCSKRISHTPQISLFLLTERSLHSKWLREKFNVPNQTSDNLTLRVTDAEQQDTCFLFFECGFPEKQYDRNGTKKKLRKDGERLLSLLKKVSAKTKYKYQLVLVFWLNAKWKLPDVYIYKALNIDKVKKEFKGNLIDLIFRPLDPADAGKNNTKKLTKVLFKIAKHLPDESRTEDTSKASSKSQTTNEPISHNGTTIELVNYDSSILEHPYFKRYQHYNTSFNADRKRTYGDLSISRVNESFYNASIKKPRNTSIINYNRVNTSLLDAPLAHSSMVQGANGNVLDAKPNRYLNGNNTAATITHDITSNGNVTANDMSFSLLNSVFNKSRTYNGFKNPASIRQPIRTTHLQSNNSTDFRQPIRIPTLQANGSAAINDQNLKSVPKNLLDLKNIISSVKSKYKKSS